jgi:replicative DNA helicase
MYPTHIPELNAALGDDDITGGFAAGEVSIIGGYSNAGKSITAQSFFSHYIQQGYKTVYFNLEVRPDLFISQLFSNLTGEWLYAKKSGEYLMPAWEKYEEIIREAQDRFILYNEDGPRNIASLEEYVERHAMDGFEIFFVDTINSMMGTKEKRTDVFTDIMVRLEALVKKYNISLIATAQMKQSVMFEDDKRPHLWDIGESVTLQQKAGTVLGVYRSDKYGSGDVKDKLMKPCDYTSLMLLKLRNRSVDDNEFVRVSYDKDHKMYIPYGGFVPTLAPLCQQQIEEQLFSDI